MSCSTSAKVDIIYGNTHGVTMPLNANPVARFHGFDRDLERCGRPCTQPVAVMAEFDGPRAGRGPLRRFRRLQLSLLKFCQYRRCFDGLRGFDFLGGLYRRNWLFHRRPRQRRFWRLCAMQRCVLGRRLFVLLSGLELMNRTLLDIPRNKELIKNDDVPDAQKQTESGASSMGAFSHDIILANSATERFNSKKIRPSLASRLTNSKSAASSLTAFTMT